MNIIIFIVAIFSGFLAIYKAINSLDKIYSLTKYGIKAKASVIRIRQVENTDSDGDSTYEYFYLVNFIDNIGKEIESEIKFSVKTKPKKRIPFTTSIFYIINDNKEYDIILEKNKDRNNGFYINLIIGLGILSYVVYSYNGQVELILEFINNLFK